MGLAGSLVVPRGSGIQIGQNPINAAQSPSRMSASWRVSLTSIASQTIRKSSPKVLLRVRGRLPDRLLEAAAQPPQSSRCSLIFLVGSAGDIFQSPS
jgi:hypothetical protein